MFTEWAAPCTGILAFVHKETPSKPLARQKQESDAWRQDGMAIKDEVASNKFLKDAEARERKQKANQEQISAKQARGKKDATKQVCGALCFLSSVNDMCLERV
jgi:hypothetical protein